MSCGDVWDSPPSWGPIPGPPGASAPGTQGVAGPPGQNAFTTLTSPYQQPAVGSNVTITVANSGWIAVDQAIFIAGGGYYTVVSVGTGGSVVVTPQAASGLIANVGVAVSSGGLVSPAGFPSTDATDYTNLSNQIQNLIQQIVGLQKNGAPVITVPPESQSVAAGANVTFSVTANGSNLTYQWSFDGNPIAGATASSYTIASAQVANAGYYTVVVSNANGSVTSSAATLVVAGTSGNQPTPPAATVYLGNSTSVGATAPANPSVGDLWFNSSNGNAIMRWSGTAWVSVQSALTLSDFGTGIRPVQVVSTLPTAGMSQGDVCFLTTDSTLYRYTGSAWTKAINGADITAGSIGTAQLAANSITTGLIAAGAITATAVGANLIITTAANIGSAVVTDAAISNVAAGKIITGTLQAGVGVTIGPAAGSSAAAFIQSANYVSGSTGFLLRGDGYFECANAVIRATLAAGQISNGAQVYNPGKAACLFNATGLTTAALTPNQGSLTTSGTYFPAITVYGWASGLGTADTTFGKATQKFLVTTNAAFNVASGDTAFVDVFYQINGGSWTQIPNTYAVSVPSGSSPCVAFTLPLQIGGLAGTETIVFGARARATNNATQLLALTMGVALLNF